MSSTPTEPRDASEAAPTEDAGFPLTGHPAIDAALADLRLGEDVHTHHDEIAAVLDVIGQALHPTQQPPLPRR